MDKEERKHWHNRTNEKLKDPTLLEDIITHVSSGGSLIELCRIWQVHFHAINSWIYKEHKEAYEQAVAASSEYMIQMIRDELKSIASIDIRQAYDESGSLKPVKDWPENLAKVVSNIESAEINAGEETIGQVKKITLWNKIKALELLGKNLSMFVDRHEFTGKVTLEDLVNSSMQGGVVETRRAHTAEIAGANPAPANIV